MTDLLSSLFFGLVCARVERNLSVYPGWLGRCESVHRPAYDSPVALALALLFLGAWMDEVSAYLVR